SRLRGNPPRVGNSSGWYEMLRQSDAIKTNFRLIEIPVRVGFGTRMDRAYEMDRKGFMLTAMGFTGRKALAFKSKYIDAFDEAERRLKELEGAGPVIAPYAVPQSFAQALQLAADQAKLIEEQGERLTIAEPKAALVDRTFKAENGVSIRDHMKKYEKV
ncbi:MAG: Rha family transcriptional regulator, partial [Hyphomicrobiales bacterium]|nr:Rha family transcriptional regulator [Hyphomicrobiales bacterium]